MIRGMGKVSFFAYSQTLNRSWWWRGEKLNFSQPEKKKMACALCGPIVVSMTGDVG